MLKNSRLLANKVGFELGMGTFNQLTEKFLVNRLVN